MASETITLNEDLQRLLSRLEHTLAKASGRGRRDPEVPGAEAEDVFVLVLGAMGTLVRRTRTSRKLNMHDLQLRLAGAEAAVTGLTSVHPAVGPAQLTESETALLDRVGFREQAPDERGEVGAFERSRIDFEVFLRDSLTLEQAGRLLRLSPGRLRQRLGPRSRTLYGFKEGRSWRIPRFQMDRRGRLVHGITKVIPSIREHAHPLAVATWFLTPHPDLVASGKEQPATPLAWLSAGLAPEVVAELAREI